MNSRIDAIAKNMKFAIGSQIVIVFANLVVRRVFLNALGEEYLGLNGLFGDILSMLSLAELGFAASIQFSLYEPLARGDREKIKSLMRLFRNVYRAVGGFVFCVGMLLTPYLNFFVKEMPAGIPHIKWIYIFNVLNSALSYFFIYKASLLFADQKKYVEIIVATSVKLASYGLQVLILLTTGNYFLYLFTQIGATFIQNVIVSRRVDRLYPYLNEKNCQPLTAEDKGLIRRNVGAMIFHKVGDVAVFGTDNLLMAKFVSVAAVGLYSNYMMIRRVLLQVVDMVFTSLTASIGNLNVSESYEKKREAFDHINFMSAWMFGFVCICLYCLFNPFITLWLGEQYLFPNSTVLIIVINFYFYCMRVPINRTKEAMGLFWNDRYKPIAEVAVNLSVSILLASRMGIDGILWGTFISTLAVPFWVEPVVLYRHGLKRPFYQYFVQYFSYGAFTVVTGCFTAWLCSLTGNSIPGFLGKMLLCGLVPNLVYYLAYHRKREYKYIEGIALRLGMQIKNRLFRAG